MKDFFLYVCNLRVMNFETECVKNAFRSLALIMQCRQDFYKAHFTFRRDFDNDYDYYLSSHHTPTL